MEHIWKALEGFKVSGISIPDKTNADTWRIDFSEGVSEEESKRAYQILRTLKYTNYAEERRKKYEQMGATIDALVIAMFENDQTEIDRLKAIRNEVKTAIPKEARK
jgi:hypothetical protein